MALTRRQRQRLGKVLAVAIPAVLAAVVAVSADWGRLQDKFLDLGVAGDLFPRIITVAARNTIEITALSFVLGLVFGLVAALLRLSPFRAYRWIGTFYVELFRGIPALVTLILVGYVIPIAFRWHVPGGDMGPKVFGLALVAGAYMAEVIRAGVLAVPPGQAEAARSLGMGPARTMVSIVLPQALRIVVPPMTNELVLLLKDSSLVFVLGTTVDTVELTKFGRDAVGSTFNGTPITIVALLYLCISLPLTRLSGALEARGARSRR